jgi:hygromycin-B 4-O-kinase
MSEAAARVELTDAAEFLSQHFSGGVSNTEFVGAGAWSRCFGFRRNGNDYVVKFGAHLQDFERDMWAGRFASETLRIPVVSEIGRAFDGWFVIATRAYGTAWEKLDSETLSKAIPSISEVMVALVESDISDTVGFGNWDITGNAPFPSWSDFLASVGSDAPERRVHGWKAALAASPIGMATFDYGYGLMMELASNLPSMRVLVHNDLFNRNTLVEKNRTTGVLDWGCSLFGDPLYELATLVFWSTYHPAIHASDLIDVVKTRLKNCSLTISHFEDRLRCCAIHIGLEHLGYNAFLNDDESLYLTESRLQHFLAN